MVFKHHNGRVYCASLVIDLLGDVVVHIAYGNDHILRNKIIYAGDLEFATGLMSRMAKTREAHGYERID